MEKKLIPYSVHLPEEIYLRVKEAAGKRRASALVRDAIINHINSNDQQTASYNQAIQDCINLVSRHAVARTVAIGGKTIADVLVGQLVSMLKEPKHVKKKS
jgi:hypothetical protein